MSSILIGLILLLVGVPFGIVLILKILFFGILFLTYHQKPLNQKFTFYKNLGVSKVILYSIAFFYDFIISLIANLILLKF